MKPRQTFSNLQIESYANEGKCIAHHEGKVVFVKGAVPGDVANVRVTKSKKDWMEAVATEIISPSADRTKPFCQHFGRCGGCQWQNMKYEKQLEYKQASVADTLERIGKISIKEKLPIAGGDEDRFYRNKLEFTFSNREWQTAEEMENNPDRNPVPALGYHLAGAFDRVFDVKTCLLQLPLSDRIRTSVKKFTVENNFSYFQLREQKGLMRGMMIRMTTTGEVMVVIMFAQREEEKILMLMNFLQHEFPEITSLQYVINQKGNDTIYDQQVITHSGTETISEKISDLEFRVSAKSFFQTNTKQAAKLYRCVSDFAALKSDDLVYDLYTGTGSIALFLARQCAHVAGIESVAQAIDDAKMNAALNHITNVSFFTADIADALNENFCAQHGMPDVVITDPPRAGMAEKVVKELLHMLPPKIIYVSCNPATQARDLQLLSSDYSVEKIRPFDMFPQTHHTECVAELKRVSVPR